MAVFGPGLLAGLSDDDPAGITTYSIVGARYGYELLWVLLAMRSLGRDQQLMGSMANGRGGDLLALAALALVALSIVGLGIALVA